MFLIGVLLITSVAFAQDANFSCDGRPQGYYADVHTGCQIYHMCDGLGRQFSYSCPNATLFQQRMLICDHWYMVNCSKSEPYYAANLLIGQRDKPFVGGDPEKHPYHRTPRPNLSINSTTEYNIIYRRMRSRTFPNLVGIDFEEENKESAASNKQLLYSPPTHWFTQYSKDATTQQVDLKNKKQKNSKTPTFNENNDKQLNKIFKIKNKPSGQVVNQKINRQKIANKKNEAPNKFSLLKRINNSVIVNKPYEVRTTTPRANTEVHKNQNKDTTKWEELRKLFLIPDYEFPLEADVRRGYDNGPSSFQVKTIPNQ